jgi:cell division protein ftsL
MENNFDITKIYMETNKKKIRFFNIFSIFLNKDKRLNDTISIDNFKEKKDKKEKGTDKKNIRLQERSRAYEEYIKIKKVKQRDVRTKFFLFLIFGILLISMPLYIIFKSAESDELFTSVNNLKSQIEEQRKENEQLALNLQNQASLVKIEQDAKYRLGMQKIEPTRIIKVQTNEKDYIETENVSIIKDKEEAVFDKIFKFLMNLF